MLPLLTADKTEVVAGRGSRGVRVRGAEVLESGEEASLVISERAEVEVVMVLLVVNVRVECTLSLLAIF